MLLTERDIARFDRAPLWQRTKQRAPVFVMFATPAPPLPNRRSTSKGSACYRWEADKIRTKRRWTKLNPKSPPEPLGAQGGKFQGIQANTVIETGLQKIPGR